MGAAHQLGRLDVDFGLRGEGASAAENEIELLDVLWQLGQSEMRLGASLQIEQPPLLKIASQDVARLITVRQPIDLVERLASGLS